MLKNRVRPCGVFVVALLFVLGLVAAGCGSSGSDSSSSSETSSNTGESSSTTSEGGISGTIRLLGITPQEAAMNAAIEEFEKANPEVKVDAQYSAPQTYYQVLTPEVRAGNAPDVFYTNGGIGQPTSIVPLAEAGKVADLSDSPWVGDIPEPAHDLYYVDDKVYGMPLWEKALGVIYNVEEFEKLGLQPPKTWQDFLQLCGDINAGGKIPVAGVGANYMYPIIGSGSTVFAEDPEWNAERSAEEVTFAETKGWSEAMEMVTEMKEAECFQPGVEGAQLEQAFQLMGSGEALMLWGPSDTIGAISSAGTAKDLAAFPLPGKSAANTRPPDQYSDSLAISASSGNQEAAKALLDFFAEPDHAAKMAELAGTISLQNSAKGVLPKSLEAFAPYYKEGKTIPYPPDTWQGSGSLEALQTGTQEILTGQNDAQGILEKADEAWGK